MASDSRFLSHDHRYLFCNLKYLDYSIIVMQFPDQIARVKFITYLRIYISSNHHSSSVFLAATRLSNKYIYIYIYKTLVL